jgi:hypothetical protein
VCVFAINDNLVGPHTLLGCRSVVVPPPHATPPIGSLDAVITGGGRVTVSGWALDPDTTAPIAVHVYVDAAGTPVIAEGARPDVAAAFAGSGPSHGFLASVPAPAGAGQVCVYAINDNPAAAHTLLGCRRLR